MIEANKVVSIDYTVMDETQTVVDTTEGRTPLAYLHGANNIIPGLEKALNGKKVGDDFEAIIEPQDTYGEHNPAMIQSVPVSAFKDVETLEIGMTFTAQGPEGEVHVVVTDIQDEQATIDANHPLAGKTLTFKVRVLDVRDASEDEISHGHVH